MNNVVLFVLWELFVELGNNRWGAARVLFCFDNNEDLTSTKFKEDDKFMVAFVKLEYSVYAFSENNSDKYKLSSSNE